MDSGELDVRRRDLRPALAVVGVAHDLDPLPAELHAYVEIKVRPPHAIDATLYPNSLVDFHTASVRLSPSCSPHKNASDSAAISNSGVAPTRIVETGLIVTSPGLLSAHANLIVANVTPSSCLSWRPVQPK